MSDLIVVERKLNKVKVAVCSIIFVLIILIIVGLCIFFHNKNKENPQEEIVNEVEEIEEQQEVVETEENTKNPVLTEEGKQNVKNIYHLEGKNAYITFDDGPSKTVTPLILDFLKQNNIPATFFLLGSRVELYPEIVKQEYDEGHYIANHGYSHVYSSIYQNSDTVIEEFEKTENAIKNALQNPDYNSHLFRFPGGSVGGKYQNIKQEAIAKLEEKNIAYVDWNALTNDSVGSPTKEKMMQDLKATVGQKSNVVILMHDAGDKILTYELLPEIIDFLSSQGYTFKNFYNIIK